VRALFAATVGRFVKSKDKGVRKMWSEVGVGVAAGAPAGLLATDRVGRG
jgi:hypothetical protein